MVSKVADSKGNLYFRLRETTAKVVSKVADSKGNLYFRLREMMAKVVSKVASARGICTLDFVK